MRREQREIRASRHTYRRGKTALHELRKMRCDRF